MIKAPYPPRVRFGMWVAALIVAAMVSGCAPISAVQLATSAVGLAMEATGITKKDSGDPKNKVTDVSLRVYASDQLNTMSNGKPLSLVLKAYVLRSPERMKTLTYQQISSPESEKEALGEELVSVREITVLPGKSYELQLKVPGDASAIGVVGMFRAPYAQRWKVAFGVSGSKESGITVGAHACALTGSQGEVLPDIGSDTPRSLVGVQCNT